MRAGIIFMQMMSQGLCYRRPWLIVFYLPIFPRIHTQSIMIRMAVKIPAIPFAMISSAIKILDVFIDKILLFI